MGNISSKAPMLPLPPFIRRFIERESASGIVMIVAALLALIAANTGLYPHYKALIGTPVTFGYGDAIATEPLKVWVKDILMVLFFLLVGLELKREMAEGFLSRKDQIILPLIAAVGGMALPALIFLSVNASFPEYRAGWAIPSATDIAFALCVLMLAGRGIPASVKIFLLAIAIFDDLGAILIIAFFYSGTLNIMALGLAAAGIGCLFLFNRLRVSAISPYIVIGTYLWFCFYHSGIHTTVAGVIVGLMIPMRSKENSNQSPVNTCIHFLHGWVGFIILPVFAFTSAGVNFDGMALSDILKPLSLGILLALFLGKQIGIFGATWLAVKSGFARLPEQAGWLHIYGVSIIAGIGFTMSLFIGLLAFPEALQNEVKVGVLAGSLLSALWGTIILKAAQRRT